MRDTRRFSLLLRFPFSRWPGLLSKILGQAIERSLPELAIFLHPLSSLPQWSGIESHFVNASIAPASKEACPLEYAQMFRHRWKRHGVRFRKMRDGFIPPCEMSQDTAPGGIGQSGERAIQGSGRIFNHLVK
jgi:hypothetical protein